MKIAYKITVWILFGMIVFSAFPKTAKIVAAHIGTPWIVASCIAGLIAILWIAARKLFRDPSPFISG